MKTYIFTNADGKAQEVTVSDEVYATIQELNKAERLNERKHNRRCISLEQSVDNGWDVADPNADIENIIDRKQRHKKMYEALNALSDEQRKLIYLVFFKGVPQVDIAKKQGVSKVAITTRIQRILKKLKKLLE